jgi:EmrB/QacA subfamily drug resistance transporter
VSPADESIPTRAWWALLVTTLVVFLAVINLSSVNVAFPSMRQDFGATDTQLSWVISGYNLVVGAFLLAAGRLSDSIGRKRVYLPGVAVFAVGSAICALAPSSLALIAGRLVQGLGGAITIAAGFAVMLPEFPASRRSTPIGIAGAAGALGAVVGPVVGSILIDLFSWRAIFWLNVPLSLIVLAIGPRLLRESKNPDATGQIDWLGVAIGTAGVGSVMLAITQTDAWGLGDVRVIAAAVIGVVLTMLLVRRSRVRTEPLLDLDLFKYQSFTSTNVAGSLYGLGFASGALVSSLLLQDIWDLPVREVGLAFAPAPVLAAIVSPFAGRWADRIGHRWILAIGCVFCATGYALYALVLDEAPAVWNQFVPIGMITGVGIGLTVATWASAGISDIPAAQFGTAGATFNTVRQVMYGLGVSIVIALVAAGGEGSFVGIQRAYIFIAVSYLAAALMVGLTFPSGSARDRTQPAPVARPAAR